MTLARPSLLQALRRAHVRLGLAAVVGAGVVLTLLSFLTLRNYVDQNLRLVARSIAYSAEAATVFDDAASAHDVLTMIAGREGLQSAVIVRTDGARLASYMRDPDNAFDESLMQAGSVLFPLQAGAPVTHQGNSYGQVNVRGNGGVYVLFLVKVLAAVALCTALIGWRVSHLSRRIERDIVRPLNKLASLTRTARTSRAFNLRAPAAAVAEIHELGEDFNALIAEIQFREAELMAKHDKLRTANASLSFLAFHDSLTGLPNRARFRESVEHALRTQGSAGAKVAVLYVDCDNFKSVNDSLGHAAGDVLLVEMALRIRAQLRDEGVVARLGGDEFAVLLAPIASIDATFKVAQRVAAAIRTPVQSPVHGAIESSASIGVAVYPDHAAGLDQLLAAADAAMYRAKARQAGHVELFDPKVDGGGRVLTD